MFDFAATSKGFWCKTIALTVAMLAGLALSNGRGGIARVAQADSGTSGTVTVHMSNASRNSAACKATGVSHLWVTVSDVQGHQSGKGAAGWHDLTPNLTNSNTSVQIDLLADAPGSEGSEPPFISSDCVLTTLDQNTTGLPAGRFQQLRLFLVPNSGSLAPSNTNACSSLGTTVFDCVQLSDGSFQPLTIPSDVVKIPSSQISRGGLVIPAGEEFDLDIDLNACQSLVVRGGPHPHGHGHGGGSASFLLKPVLHAGEVSLEPILAGNVVVGTDSGAGTAVTPSATVVPGATVFLESESNPAVDVGDPAFDSAKTAVPLNAVLAQTTTDSSGKFSFCPVPAGTYDIVVDSQTVPSAANPSDATITTGVTVKSTGGPDNLVIPILEGSVAAVTLGPEVTTQHDSTTAGSGDDIAFLGTQGFGGATPTNQAPIPLFTGTTTSPVTTASSSNGCSKACPTNTNCACFSVVAPPDNPVTGVAGGPYTSGSGTAEYSLFGAASLKGTTTPDCTPSDLITEPESTFPTPPTATLAFAACVP